MRRGVVLFITLAILLMLGGIVTLFLKEGLRIKKSVRENIAVIQTNLLLDDMSGFLKKQNFSQRCGNKRNIKQGTGAGIFRKSLLMI